MTIFADASALVKLYADEEDSDSARILENRFLVSELSRVEVPAALWRKQRTGELDSSFAADLVADFEADWYVDPGIIGGRFDIVGLDHRTFGDAARACATHGLRPGDAIQLSTALLARSSAAEVDTFLAFDRSLRRAAMTEGFTTVPR